jgi:hypothetical protein
MAEDMEYLEQNEETVEDALDNDELSAEEDGFLRGYDEESEPDEEFGIDSEVEDE